MKKRTASIFVSVVALAMIVCLCLCLVACSAKASYPAYDEGYASPSEAVDNAKSVENEKIVTTSDRMIVYSVEWSLGVKNRQESVAAVKAKLQEYGGYEKSSYTSETSGEATLTMKVPTENLDAFLSSIEGNGETYHRSVSSYDVTDSYYSTLQKKNALIEERTRLSEELDSGELTFEQRLVVHTRLAEIAEKIGRYEDDLESYKKDVEYSTVTLHLYEQGTYEEPGYWDSLGEVLFGSGKSVGTVFGWILKILVAILPYFGILVVLFGLYVLVKFIVCKAKKIPFTLFKSLRDRRVKVKARKQASVQKNAVKPATPQEIPAPQEESKE